MQLSANIDLVIYMKIINGLHKVIETVLETEELNLKLARDEDTLNGFYAECGKAIFEISNLYPANEIDAAIIFEEWCKGILSECRPDHDILREYAEYTADPIQFHLWKLIITKNRFIKGE